MASRAVTVAMLAAASAALVVLLTALLFLPVAAWQRYVPVATVVGGIAVVLAGVAAQASMEHLVRPLRRMVRAMESERVDRETFLRFLVEVPEEVAHLLRVLRRTQARLQDTVDELERDRAQMAVVQEHLADGVLVVNAQEQVTASNPAAALLLRQSRMHGRFLAEVVRDSQVVDVVRAASGSVPVAHVVELHQPAAPRRWVRVIATRLPSQQHTLVVLQDVTDLRRAEAARRDFVANVSHELRTPIAALKALVETLEAGALEDPQVGREFLRRMHVEVDDLAQLVSELLELARVEAGRIDLDLQPTQVGRLLREAAERAAPYAQRVGLEIALAELHAGEVLVEVDTRRIGQVLANLLANAVKFTPPGGRVELGAREDGQHVECWVRDTGIGIAPENHARIFERFYKTDFSRAGAGTGLGLAICKHLVQAHGGSIWVESAGEGQGATFHFTLRRGRSGAARSVPLRIPSAPPAGANHL